MWRLRFLFTFSRCQWMEKMFCFCFLLFLQCDSLCFCYHIVVHSATHQPSIWLGWLVLLVVVLLHTYTHTQLVSTPLYSWWWLHWHFVKDKVQIFISLSKWLFASNSLPLLHLPSSSYCVLVSLWLPRSMTFINQNEFFIFIMRAYL